MKCINCGNKIENDSEFCYFCGCDPSKKSDNEHVNINGEAIRDAQQMQYFDYSIHGADPLYELKGTNGRYLVVYKHKCVIKVDVTIGSVLTHNATDGEKTIYYKDIIGIQLKRPGILIGYIQFETASSKGNNIKSNFFDENSFTYDNYDDIYDIYKYIIKRLDEIKML